jgi:hypothetical protein
MLVPRSTVRVSAADVRASLTTSSCGRRLCSALEFSAILSAVDGSPCDCDERETL